MKISYFFLLESQEDYVHIKLCCDFMCAAGFCQLTFIIETREKQYLILL